jgi:vacuolar-type H+-ATPase subunit D/Vma8
MKYELTDFAEWQQSKRDLYWVKADLAEALDTLQLVKRAREAQKAYFKSRTQEALIASKQLEKELDTAASAILTKHGRL